MGRELYEKEPLFRETMDRCFKILKPLMGINIKEILYPKTPDTEDIRTEGGKGDGKTKTIDKTAVAQPLIFILEYALSRLLMQWGITPNAMVGHSLGEYTAACLAGVFSLEDALRVVVERGRLMQQEPPGSMLGVQQTGEELTPLLDRNPEISLAANNGPANTTVSGPGEAIEDFERQLKEKGYKSRKLHTSHAFHSAMMEPVLKPFEEKLRTVTLNKPGVPYISNVTGNWITTAETTDPRYWSKHLRSTVRFTEAVNTLLGKKNRIFIEVGPGRALSTFVKAQATADRGNHFLNTMGHPREAEPEIDYLYREIGRMWLLGKEVNWQEFHGGEKRRRIPLPTYPFVKQRYWIDGTAITIPPGQPLKKPHQETTGTAAEDKNTEAQPRPQLFTPYEAPLNKEQREIAAIWKNMFGFDKIGIRDDFFELGGDSLKATRLASKINETFEVKIPLAEIFQKNTISKLAGYIDELSGKTIAATPAIEPAEEREYYPISGFQEKSYRRQQLNPGGVDFNMPVELPIMGELKPGKLKRIFTALIKRHTALRTTFHQVGDQILQRIHDEVEIEIMHYSAEPAANRCHIDTFVTPFDLAQPPLIRVGIRENEPGKYNLLVDIHHSIGDGASQNILLREFWTLYNDTAEKQWDIDNTHSSLPPVRLQYKDYLMWQQRAIAAGSMKQHEEYWLKKLAGKLPQLQLPTDFPRPGTRSFEGDGLAITLEKKLQDKIKAHLLTNGVTLYMLLLAAYTILLSKITGQEDIIVGTPVSCRLHEELENTVGPLLNGILMRSRVTKEKSYQEYLGEIKDDTLDAYEHQQYPKELLIKKIAWEESAGRNPVTDVALNVLNVFDARMLKKAGFDKTPADGKGGQHETTLRRASKLDITMLAVEVGERIEIALEYCTRLFERQTIEDWAARFKQVLWEVLENPQIRLGDIGEPPEAFSQKAQNIS
ncbi:MAG: acyltransferase domain-containing protein [bacterium]|nr:acyltransferase domain-containing protein [bacterium]